MAVVRTIIYASIGIGAGLSLPSMISTPPLRVQPNPEHVAAYELRALSDLAAAGLMIYRAECETCHGGKAGGTRKAPGLGDPRFHNGQAGRRAFHLSVADAGPHRGLADVQRLSFNQIEQVARYVREARGFVN